MPTCKVTPTKWSTNASWESPEEKPGATTDAVFVEKSATGAALKLETNVSTRSIEAAASCTGTIVLNVTTLTMKIGTAASVNPTNVAIKLAPGMTLTLSAGSLWELISNVTTPAQTITCAGKTLPNITFNGKGKWQLEDAFSAELVILTEGELKTNGQTVASTSNFSISGAVARTLKLGASVVTIGGEWNAETTTNLTFSAETSTIKLTGASSAFSGGALTYNIVTLEAAKQKVKQSSTFATLNVNNKGDATGISLEKGTTQTVTTLATNGTEANPAKLISDTSGTQAKLKITGAQTVSYLKCKDIKVETGSLVVNIPTGTKAEYDLGGNEGITFEEPAVGGSVVPTMVV